MEDHKRPDQLATSDTQGDLNRVDVRAWPMTAWLDVLHALLPPCGALLVGAGWGSGVWVQWLRTRDVSSGGVRVHLLEGDEQKYRHLQQGASDDGWMVRRAVVAPAPGAATFHRTSSSAESGLLSGTVQQALWPNLIEECAIAVDDAITLDMAHAQADGLVNWLFLDCLPGAALLQGGEQLLERLDVALIRVASGLPDAVLADPCAVDGLLEQVGMRRIHSQVERHPGLAHVLYVRDSANEVRRLLAACQRAQARTETVTGQLRVMREAADQAKRRARELLEERNTARDEAEKAQRRGRQLQHKLKSAEQGTSEKARKAKSAAGAVHGDADIDDFLNDVGPFFSGRSVTYVDVGAYIGEIPLKIIGHGAIRIREAHLFEPNPESFKQLTENAKSLNVPNLHLYNHALGANDSVLTFSASKSMTKVVDLEGNPNMQTGLFRAEARRLDDLKDLFTECHIDLLKVDVEGFEMEVIDGAEGLLREQRVDMIYIEVGFNKTGTQQSYFGSIDRRLQEFGYRVFRIYEQRNEWIQDSPLLRRCNFAYMSARFAEANPYKARKEIVRLKDELMQMKKEMKRGAE